MNNSNTLSIKLLISQETETVTTASGWQKVKTSKGNRRFEKIFSECGLGDCQLINGGNRRQDAKILSNPKTA